MATGEYRVHNERTDTKTDWYRFTNLRSKLVEESGRDPAMALTFFKDKDNELEVITASIDNIEKIKYNAAIASDRSYASGIANTSGIAPVRPNRFNITAVANWSGAEKKVYSFSISNTDAYDTIVEAIKVVKEAAVKKKKEEEEEEKRRKDSLSPEEKADEVAKKKEEAQRAWEFYTRGGCGGGGRKMKRRSSTKKYKKRSSTKKYKKRSSTKKYKKRATPKKHKKYKKKTRGKKRPRTKKR
jgi:hypothetical protein